MNQLGRKPVIIIRHYRERLSKCTVEPLRGRNGYIFRTYQKHGVLDLSGLPDLSDYFRLDPQGVPLDRNRDAGKGILLIDATWRYAEKMIPLFRDLPARSLPETLRTAYPRRQFDAPNPETGLASIEALYACLKILGEETDSILDNYHWKDKYIEINKDIFDIYS